MNFPGVIARDASVAAKLEAFADRPIDGHAPGILGKPLNAYIAAGVGSDHECVTVDEAKEKLARGLYILIREATNAHNLDALLPLVTEKNSRRICFCSDDRQPADLLNQGSVDYMVRRAIEFGIDPVTAFRMATLNTVEWFQLHDRGAIAPGRFADLMIFDDLNSPKAKAVFAGGRIVAEQGHVRGDLNTAVSSVPPALLQTVNLHLPSIDFTVKARAGKLRVIESQANQLLTKASVVDAKQSNGSVIADPSRDLLKIAVIERHTGGGRTGLGFIRGFGLKRGAIAGTVAHDHHNLIVIGADDESMQTAVAAVLHADGGYAVADGSAATVLALPVAGLMSDLAITAVAQRYSRLLARAAELGATPDDPFMAMSFMALEVIPSLKLTDQGLIDVDTFRKVDLFVE
jgi:adenine deaminase